MISERQFSDSGTRYDELRPNGLREDQVAGIHRREPQETPTYTERKQDEHQEDRGIQLFIDQVTCLKK